MSHHKLQRTLLPLGHRFNRLPGAAAVPANAADSPAIIQPDAPNWAPFRALPPGTQLAVRSDPSKAGTVSFALSYRPGTK